MSQSTVLVTGGAGYIGSHVCKLLARSGFLPVTFDNLVHGHAWAVRWGPLERGELIDGERLEAVMRRHRPLCVIHFAAWTDVGESVRDPLAYYRNNVAGTLSLLGAMRDADIDRIVFSSTCATYGVPETDTLAEAHPQRPVNPYGHSKLMIEQILRDCSRAYGMRSVALRYFNAAGADADGELGEWHEPETHLIPLVLRAAAQDGGQVNVFGRDYPTPDGTCIRDYIHVQDLAAAHLLGMHRLEREEGHAAFNLGTGRGYSVMEVVEAARRVTGRPVPVRYGERRAGDPPRLVADARKAGEVLGWHPHWTRIEDIIDSAWRWHTALQAAQPAANARSA